VDALTVVPDGDPTVASEQSLVPAPAPLPATVPGPAVELRYRFEPGWKFVRVVPRDAALAAIPGRPRALGFWAHGDGSRCRVRLRFIDSTGQTHQPSGPRLDWRGWRYLEIPLDGRDSSHWGGANDGRVHYPIRWDTVFLLDSADRRRTQGAVRYAGLTLLFAGHP